jgi:hypothetical protein
MKFFEIIFDVKYIILQNTGHAVLKLPPEIIEVNLSFFKSHNHRLGNYHRRRPIALYSIKTISMNDDCDQLFFIVLAPVFHKKDRSVKVSMCSHQPRHFCSLCSEFIFPISKKQATN